ncbi:MAG TPA: DUF2007 domain-containing protein [Porticoccaceae bacterium]|nr:DUF2007 domain-containing protein [Porticoccaceae bacterium]HIK80507.1 DUF2007 domain-containing protein [Porticoccaceae bacterium]
MISVYRGSDYFEAQLLRDLIEQAGLQVFLHGASLQGGLGEVAVMGHLSIMVNESDQANAADIVTAYERGDFTLQDE